MQAKVVLGTMFVITAVMAVVTDGFTESLIHKSVVVTTPVVNTPTVPPVVVPVPPVVVGNEELAKAQEDLRRAEEERDALKAKLAAASTVHVTDPDTLVDQNPAANQDCGPSGSWGTRVSGSSSGPIRRFFRRGR